ncbi:MAG: NUDIX hydrolase [Burkholderiales bacterium]|nr:NUDIX hydrolase [Burkholderiales bacterium]
MKEISGRAKSLSFERPLVTVDVLIFSLRETGLSLLLMRRPNEPDDPYPGRWALPGGFVDVGKDRTLEDCAARKLLEKTGVKTPYLEQLGSWGGATRDPRGWSVTHAYFGLINAHTALGDAPGLGVRDAQWFPIDEAASKRLAFDHSQILGAAVTRLRGKVEYTSLPAFLLPEPFTLPQLQAAYETVLGRPMDKSAFRKRMLDAGFLEEAGAVDGFLGRSAMGYRIGNRTKAVTFPRTFKPSK